MEPLGLRLVPVTQMDGWMELRRRTQYDIHHISNSSKRTGKITPQPPPHFRHYSALLSKLSIPTMADVDTKTPKSPGSESSASDFDERSPEVQKQEKELANRLAHLIEDANEKIIPICKLIRKVGPIFHLATKRTLNS